MSLAKVLAPERIALASACTEEEALEEAMAAASAIGDVPTKAQRIAAEAMGIPIEFDGSYRLNRAIRTLEIYRGVTCA